MEYYNYKELEILIPRIFGAEAKKKIPTSTGNRKGWDEKSYFEEIEKHLSGSKLDAVKKLYEYSDAISDRITWGTGIVRGSFNPKIDSLGRMAPYTVFTDGKLHLNFGNLVDNDSTKRKRKMFLEALSNIEDFNIPKDAHDKFPNVSIEIWHKKTDELISIIGKTLLSNE